SHGRPSVCAFRSLTTRPRAARSFSLLIPVAMTSAASASLTGPRTSATSSRDSSAIGRTSCHASPLFGGGGVCRRLGLARGAPFLETANHNKERRHEQYGQAGRGEHAPEHR